MTPSGGAAGFGVGVGGSGVGMAVGVTASGVIVSDGVGVTVGDGVGVTVSGDVGVMALTRGMAVGVGPVVEAAGCVVQAAPSVMISIPPKMTDQILPLPILHLIQTAVTVSR
jgi:hypothetical protein